MYEKLALFGGFILLYSSVAGGVERSWISGAILFTCFGLIVGPVGLDLLSWQSDHETLRTLAELTLAVLLFTDAASSDLKVLRRASALPVRLLLIGLPLTLFLGIVVGVILLDDLSLLGIALLATILSPTDAALGKAVVVNKGVPDDIRQGLNVESGLNDGICVPILFVFLALALGKTGGEEPWMLALKLVVEEIGIGLVVGLTLTFLAVRLLRFAAKKNWLTHTWIQVPVTALALTCFASAQLLGGSGFIAAWCGGLLFAVKAGSVREKFLIAGESSGDTLALITWVIFGGAVVGQAIGNFSWMILLYSALSLTVIRMLPVFLSLTGSGMSTGSKLFVGWFGPRGLASVVFTVIVLDSGLPNTGTIAMTVACTIILSILLHGITAKPFIAGLAASLRKSQDKIVSKE